MSDWREQEVINETSARDINEWIDGSNESVDADADMLHEAARLAERPVRV